MCVLPADPIWHRIYGQDLTAWSIPHVLLFVSFGAILLLATAIHMTAQPPRAWGTPRQIRGADVLPLVMFAATSLSWNQFFTTEWDGGARFVLARPEWLLPVLIVSGAAFIGVLANHTLRVFGAATLSGVLALIWLEKAIYIWCARLTCSPVRRFWSRKHGFLKPCSFVSVHNTRFYTVGLKVQDGIDA